MFDDGMIVSLQQSHSDGGDNCFPVLVMPSGDGAQGRGRAGKQKQEVLLDFREQ